MVSDAVKAFFRIYSILIGFECTFQLGLRKLCSKKFGLNIWAPIPIQRYENTSGYDTEEQPQMY